MIIDQILKYIHGAHRSTINPKNIRPLLDYQSIITSLFDYQWNIEIYTHSYVLNWSQEYTSVPKTNHYLIIKQILKYIHIHTCTINHKNIPFNIWLSNNHYIIYAFIRVESIQKIYVCTKYKPIFDYQSNIEIYTRSYVYNQSQKYTFIIWLSNNHYIIYMSIRVQPIQKIYVCIKYKPLFDYQANIEIYMRSYVYNQSQKYTIQYLVIK